MRVVVGVVLVLVAFATLANCSQPRQWAPAPAPAPSVFVPRPYATPDSADEVEAGEDTEDTDVYVDVDSGDDDGESWFCQRRRWC